MSQGVLLDKDLALQLQGIARDYLPQHDLTRPHVKKMPPGGIDGAGSGVSIYVIVSNAGIPAGGNGLGALITIVNGVATRSNEATTLFAPSLEINAQQVGQSFGEGQLVIVTGDNTIIGGFTVIAEV
jgi:hypothetical protein